MCFLLCIVVYYFFVLILFIVVLYYFIFGFILLFLIIIKIIIMFRLLEYDSKFEKDSGRERVGDRRDRDRDRYWDDYDCKELSLRRDESERNWDRDRRDKDDCG